MKKLLGIVITLLIGAVVTHYLSGFLGSYQGTATFFTMIFVAAISLAVALLIVKGQK